jgi:hypothetical protein
MLATGREGKINAIINQRPLRPTHGWDQMKVTEIIKAVCSCFRKRARCKFLPFVVSQPVFCFWKARFAAEECAGSRPVTSHCLTAPHSSNRKDSRLLLCNIRESKMQSEQHCSQRQRALCHRKKVLFVSYKNLGGGGGLVPRFLRPCFAFQSTTVQVLCNIIPLYIVAFFDCISLNFNFTFQLTRTVKVAIASKTSQTFTGKIPSSVSTVGILMTDTRSFQALVHI